ncbi:MAG: helix-turn-helix transcriptional regulator [Deltaproteobacteria bacterium]|nr:helix-turn-helix transcriptional regulator [Deltaproteobacteria bacterium]
MEQNKVQDLREHNAWSIAELARKAELAPQTVSKMEKGVKTAKNSKLKVAKALGVQFDEIFPD